MDSHKNIWGSSYFTMQLLPGGWQHSWGSTQPSWSRAWGSSWNLHALLSSCSETLGCFSPTASPECLSSHCFCWGFSGLSTLGPCTGTPERYQNIPLPPGDLYSWAAQSFSDKNLQLARIRGDLCSALTLEQLPQVLWIRCQLCKAGTCSDEQGPAPAQLMVGQRGRHWHHDFAPRITSHCRDPSCQEGKTVTV